jgi:hypothetical protein
MFDEAEIADIIRKSSMSPSNARGCPSAHLAAMFGKPDYFKK